MSTPDFDPLPPRSTVNRTTCYANNSRRVCGCARCEQARHDRYTKRRKHLQLAGNWAVSSIDEQIRYLRARSTSNENPVYLDAIASLERLRDLSK